MRVCGQPGCSVLVDKGNCPEHTNTAARQAADRHRGSAYRRGYDGTRWKRSRDGFIAKYPYCGMRPNKQPPVMSRCHNLGLRTLGYQVDHVIPHKGDQALFWDVDGNWQTLCASCGAAKSAAGQ